MSEFLWYLERWYFSFRRFLAFIIFITMGWSFLELIGPGQVIKEALIAEIQATFPFNLFVKEDPAKIEEEARKKAWGAVQARCYHLYERNGLKNHFCPFCRKKLLPGDYPFWQI